MTSSAASDAVTAARQDYLAALLSGRRRDAFAVIDAAVANGVDITTAYIAIFQPALREIGRLWEENAISVADEHLATAITEAAMVRLFERSFREGRRPERPTIVAACVDSERHQVGLRMLCDLLEARGWDAHYLGASVPAEALVRMVEARRPAVVALSAALTPHVPRMRSMIAALRAAGGTATPIIIVGGRPFLTDPALAAEIGADLTARDAAEAVELLEQRVAVP